MDLYSKSEKIEYDDICIFSKLKNKKNNYKRFWQIGITKFKQSRFIFDIFALLNDTDVPFEKAFGFKIISQIDWLNSKM